MLNIGDHIPIKETLNKLSKFPRLSVIEKFYPKFFETPTQGAIAVAHLIRDKILQHEKNSKSFVLGLASGLTPLATYQQLVRLHKQQGLSFKNVVTFQLDEYYPIDKDDQLSYHYFLKSNLYDLIDLLPENTHSIDSEIDRDKVSAFCEKYQKEIIECGGIDLQILGIGRSGHIGFNEPPSGENSRTRMVYLHRLTRKDAAGIFRGIQKVPQSAITMGISTIKKAKQIAVMAWSEAKAPIVKKSIEGQTTPQNPVSLLQNHPNITFYLDKSAGQLLSRFTVPWTIRGDTEDPQVPLTKYWILKAVIWLSLTVNKPILQLTQEDYQDHGLSHLTIQVGDGNVENINLFVYRDMRQKITGWPLGDRPDSKKVYQGKQLQKKSLVSSKILVFSPHPDDDVISMGGTVNRLVDQGHTVHIAYMTPGSNAVHDHDAKKYLYFMQSFNNMKIANSKSDAETKMFCALQNSIHQGLKHVENKIVSQARIDNFSITNLKSHIRSCQAKIAVDQFGINERFTYNLNLPFYGNNKKKVPISQEDYKIVRDLLKMTEPDVIYAAGDLTDPHGTHRKCLEIILKIIDEQYEKLQKDPEYKSLVPKPQKILFYRGAWQEWDLAQARYMVFMSPLEVKKKHQSILRHQSQKDRPMFPGEDSRQFWERVKQRNRGTAEILNQLGFSEYEAVQCFVDLNDLRDGDAI